MVVQRLWEILLFVPTHTEILQQLFQLTEFIDNEANNEIWSNYLQRSDPFRLTYSLQIIDMLIRRMPNYKDLFVRKGGLKYLYDLFISRSFFTGPSDRSWCAGLPDALLYALKILSSCLLKIPTPTILTTPQTQSVAAPAPPASAPPSDDPHSPRTPVNARKKVKKNQVRSSFSLMNEFISFRLDVKQQRQQYLLLSHRLI